MCSAGSSPTPSSATTLGAADADVPAFALLDGVVGVQAELIAQWMLVGFVHGVMNTDNTTISGETIDYGPCAFMNRFDPRHRASSIDHGGRYRYAHQPSIAEWNSTDWPRHCCRSSSTTTDRIWRPRSSRPKPCWRRSCRGSVRHGTRMRTKLGLVDEHDDDGALFDGLIAMRDDRADLDAHLPHAQ
ncbi:MAG: protein adenylyltransferase SelO family protein [Ilumatobacteraceae bacterium]